MRHFLLCVGLFVAPIWAGEVAFAAPTTAPASSDPSAHYGAERYRVVSEPGEVVAVLNNGMTVIAKRVATPVVAVRGYVRTGGVYEGQWLGGGLSHLLEHLVAGGSSDRRTEAENRTLLQEIGNNSNAYTTDDHTAFFINTTPANLDKAADLLTGWLLGAKITPAEYQREYQVVQRELEMGKGEPGRQFYMLMQSNRYHVSPARVPTIGYQQVIRGLLRDDVYAYYKLAYQPQNMVFSAAGDMDVESMVAAVRKYVDDAPPGREFSHDIAAEPPVLARRTVVATAPKIGQAKLSLAFPTVRLDSPDLYALDLLAACLSDGDSAILVRKLRDDLQLVSGIDAYSATPAYVEGSFVITAELETDKIKPATEAVLAALDEIKKRGIDDQVLSRARAQMKVARVRGTQTAEDIAATLAGDWLTTGDIHFTEHYLQRIDQVTSEAVRAAAARYLDPRRLITTAMLPSESAPAGLPQAVDLLRAAGPAATATTGPAGPSSQTVRTVLDNGTILLTRHIATSPLVAVRMYALGGVSIENADTNGLGNLTMQLLPRGTTTRSAEQIAEFFDSLGAQLETVCGNNTFSWQASCLNDDLPKVLDVFADVVNNPAFDDHELAAMKLRVAAAIETQDADWTNQAFRFFKKAYYGPLGSPYQFSPLGSQANLDSFDAAQIRRWYEKVAQQPRVLAIYGDISTDEAQALAKRFLDGKAKRVGAESTTPGAVDGAVDAATDGAVPRRSANGPSTSPETGSATGPSLDQARPPSSQPSVVVERVEVQQTTQPLAGIVIGYDSRSVVGAPYIAALDVADTMASGYTFPTGYLHETLRGQGLVYVVHGMNLPGRSKELAGSFIVYAGCDPANVDVVVEQILLNIARLQGTEKDRQAGWMERAKQLMVIDEAMGRQTPAEQAEAAALNELYGLGYIYPDHFADRVNKVDSQDVQDVAARRLARCVVTISTPQPQVVKVKTGVRRYDTFPPVDLTPRGVQHDTAGQ
jgi:zinc protease